MVNILLVQQHGHTKYLAVLSLGQSCLISTLDCIECKTEKTLLQSLSSHVKKKILLPHLHIKLGLCLQFDGSQIINLTKDHNFITVHDARGILCMLVI